MKLFLAILACFSLSLLATEQLPEQPQTAPKRIAISFDDAPTPSSGYFSGEERTSLLLESLAKAGIEQTAFFAVSQHITPEGHQRLLAYSKAGHIIANHTHSHPNLNSTSLSHFIADIEQADSVLQHYPTFRKWFRFPYLREGDTLNKRDGVRQYLADNDYINAYITLNNYDWYLDELFQQAIQAGESIDLTAMRNFYVETLLESIQYYDELALQYLNRSPDHVLLLHENDLAALFISDLIAGLQLQGWEIITIEQAYQDPLLSYQTSRLLTFNPGRIGEIAADHGQRKGLWHTTLNEAYLKKRFTENALQQGIRQESATK